MEVFTSYYGNAKKLETAGIQLIGISLGTPKYLNNLSNIRMLAPDRDMMHLSHAEYKVRYMEKLKSLDWNKVKEMIKTFSNGKDVALCCYESLKVEGEWCHRTMLAEYINQRTGKEVILEWKEKEKNLPIQGVLL